MVLLLCAGDVGVCGRHGRQLVAKGEGVGFVLEFRALAQKKKEEVLSRPFGTLESVSSSSVQLPTPTFHCFSIHLSAASTVLCTVHCAFLCNSHCKPMTSM